MSAGEFQFTMTSKSFVICNESLQLNYRVIIYMPTFKLSIIYKQPIVWAACIVWNVDGLQLDWNPEKKGTIQVKIVYAFENILYIFMIYLISSYVYYWFFFLIYYRLPLLEYKRNAIYWTNNHFSSTKTDVARSSQPKNLFTFTKCCEGIMPHQYWLIECGYLSCI